MDKLRNMGRKEKSLLFTGIIFIILAAVFLAIILSENIIYYYIIVGFLVLIIIMPLVYVLFYKSHLINNFLSPSAYHKFNDDSAAAGGGSLPSRVDIVTSADGERFVFFWKVDQPNCVFSQWYKCRFQDNKQRTKITFTSAEQYMMYKKADYFGDTEIGQLILESNDQQEIKALGRKVKGFNDDEWDRVKERFVYEANLLKFTNNEGLKKLLLQTNGMILAEASPYDLIWGIGLEANNPLALDQANWKGKNLLGFILMKVRNEISGDGNNFN